MISFFFLLGQLFTLIPNIDVKIFGKAIIVKKNAINTHFSAFFWKKKRKIRRSKRKCRGKILIGVGRWFMWLSNKLSTADPAMCLVGSFCESLFQGEIFDTGFFAVFRQYEAFIPGLAVVCGMHFVELAKAHRMTLAAFR